MDFREKIDKNMVNFFVEKMVKINEIFKKQMVFVQASYKHYANIHKQNAPNYVLNDEMWLDTRNMQTKRLSKKLSDKFDNLFPITKIINPHVYKLELFHNWTIHPVFHTNLLKPKSDNFLPNQLTTFPFLVFIIDDENQNIWEMTKILNFKMHKNKFQLLINWVGDRPYWQFFEKVIGTPYALNKYYCKYFIRPCNDVWQQYKINHTNEF